MVKMFLTRKNHCMKKIFFILIVAVYITAGFSSCKKADAVIRMQQSELSDIYATVAGKVNDRLVTARYSAAKDTIYFDVPWYYPVNSDNDVDITKMLIKAAIPTDAVVTPSLANEVDLTNPFHFTVTAGDGKTTEYVVVTKKVGDVSITSAKISFTTDGAEQEVDGVVIGNEVLFYIFPGLDVSNATLTYELNKRSSGSLAYGSSIDLSQNVPFTVTGVGGTTKTYTLRATAPVKQDYGAGINRKLWKKSGAELGFTTDNETSIAVSGDFLVAASKTSPSTYRVFNRFTGEYLRDLAVPPFSGMSMQLVNDDNGHLLGTSYSGVGSRFYVYKYANANDANPVKLIDWVNTTPSGDPSWIGAVGRAVNVYGDLDNDAVITATGAFTNIFQRWVIKGGQLVSNTPEQVTYAGTGNMGVWADVQPVSANPAADYFVSYQSEVALVNGITNERIKAFSFGWPVLYTRPVAYARFNNANYLAVVKYVNSYSLNQVILSLFDVTQPSRIPISESDPEYASFNIYTSDLLSTGADGITGDVTIGFTENGDRMQVYMLLTNGGIIAHEFTSYAP
jgi:hypothetical protein